jgi:hypothetical protein
MDNAQQIQADHRSRNHRHGKPSQLDKMLDISGA